ncbi:MAG TPA: hypothetical protein VJB34_03160 [Bdellovibrionota bacterium]|nr:hypothetical protein [Bdellovibrionota bacterium]
MKKNLLLLFFSISFQAFSQIEICVLGYERPFHPYSTKLEQLFANRENILLINQALPKDFLTCLDENPREIIILAHALEMKIDSHRYNLAYFKKLTDQEIEEYHLKPNQEYWVPKPFLSRIFQKAKTMLAQKEERGEEIRLKRIRLVSCVPEVILQRYEDLNFVVEHYGIHIDASPKQELMSALNGKTVTQLDYFWLGESIQFDDGISEYFFTYLNLTTIVLYRYGSSETLRGQYRVKINGLAAGLSSKWSLLAIPYSKVRDLEIGESRSFLTPHLDVSAALWLNLEVDVWPLPNIQLPSETNSLGVSVGLFSHVTITRLY